MWRSSCALLIWSGYFSVLVLFPRGKERGDMAKLCSIMSHIGMASILFISLMYLSYTTSWQNRVALLFSTSVNGQLRCRDLSSASAVSVPSILKISLRCLCGCVMEFYVNLSLAVFITYLPTALNMFYIHKGLQQSSRKSHFS